jgi:sugar transferase EpsL
MLPTNRLLLKRVFDLALCIPAIVALSPVLAWIAWRVRQELGSPVLFRQERLGFRGSSFRILKFRSMTDERDERGELLPDEARLTAFGRALRARSLDELPELMNVIRGDMSVVGPRPLLPRYRDRYSPRQRVRHDAPPGITGLAQVNGRNAITWEKRLELDVWYVENWSFGLDVRILWKTFGQVLRGEGVSAEGHSTMPEFFGSAGEDE